CCCDPRPPRTAAAAGHPRTPADPGAPVAILGRRGRRPLPRVLGPVQPSATSLRSSAAADGGRCPD
ncbi:MAG: hypothetical protein M3R66_07900, partial [Actinomycetota bacterium]|nr:hypothetical protein [Actinomycetota bacterium]